MAQFYGMPIWATAGRTDAKIPDAQAAYEHALTIPYVALAGANHVTCGAGFLDSVLSVSFAQYVIDNEIIGMVKRMLRGFETDSEAMALDVIKGVGPGGHFIAEEHTFEHMRRELFQPALSDRDDWETWEASGGLDAFRRAQQKARDLIAGHVPQGLTPDHKRDILNSVGGIVKDPGPS